MAAAARSPVGVFAYTSAPASGGAGTPEHFAEALDAGADAVLAASVFHFGTLTIAQVKESIRAHGHPVR